VTARAAAALAKALACAGAVAVVSSVIRGLDEVAPLLSLGALYLFAVMPIAVLWGLAYAVLTSILGVLSFNFFFLHPVHTLTLAEPQHWVALAVYLATAVVVSELAVSVRRRAADAEQRGREEAFLADLATRFLQGARVEDSLAELSGSVAQLLAVEGARIELGPERAPPPGESPYELRAAGTRVGTLYVREGAEPRLAFRKRFLPALASVLAVAVERERFLADAVEAEALRRSDTVKTAVLRAASHDLRSPLTAIIAATGTLRSPALVLSDEDRDALLETVAVEASRLQWLVRDLLDLSRLEAGAAVPVAELWSVDDLVAQALEEIGQDSARVDVSLPADLPPVRVDAAQLRRALANLLENALKFSGPREPVAVRATATRREVIVRVVDRGPGLSPQEVERVFEAFYRTGEDAPTWGSGLGLAIARGFVEANGGRVWAESREGQGSSFAIALQAVPLPVHLPT
jgi:two-component system sensor histidine kinase KdpD